MKEIHKGQSTSVGEAFGRILEFVPCITVAVNKQVCPEIANVFTAAPFVITLYQNESWKHVWGGGGGWGKCLPDKT